MPDRLEWFGVTIPANTPQNNLFTSLMVFNIGTVVEIDVKVLSGPSGTVGFFIAAGGTQYVPRTRGSFIIPDDDYFTWPQKSAINSGSWALTGYNLDVWDHMIQVAFQVNEDILGQQPQDGQVGSSSQNLLDALTGSGDQTVQLPDPLSPDILIPSVPVPVEGSPGTSAHKLPVPHVTPPKYLTLPPSLVTVPRRFRRRI